VRRVLRDKDGKKKQAPLSRLEGLIIGVLWDRTEATAKEVREILADTKPMAHTTVLTVLSRLQEKGYIKQVPSMGRSLMFRPIVSRDHVARLTVTEVLARFFGGSPEQLVAHLVEEENLKPAELEKLRRRLDQSKSKPRTK